MTEIVDTLGEARVRMKFNPSNNDLVSEIKYRSAELINLVNAIQGDGETRRLVALAMTHYEDAAMWAVKAATALPGR